MFRAPSFLLVLCMLTSSVSCERKSEQTPARQQGASARDSLVDRWDLWCATESRATERCLARTGSGYEVFLEDGSLSTFDEDSDEARTKGSWTLEGDTLHRSYEVGGLKAEDSANMRIAGNRLVLWKEDARHGFIYQRHGTAPEEEHRAATTGEVIESAIEGRRYRIAIPKGYRIASDGHGRQQWRPIAGDGVSIQMVLTESSECSSQGRSEITETSDSGLVSLSWTECVDSRHSLRCEAFLQEGVLSEAQAEAGRSVCATFESLGAPPLRQVP